MLTITVHDDVISVASGVHMPGQTSLFQQVRVVALVGFSGSGKTTLITEVTRHLPVVQFVKSFTTRARREPADDNAYEFVTFDELNAYRTAGAVLQEVTYAGNVYGNTVAQFDRIGPQNIGILAMTEEGARTLRSRGYIVRIVKVEAVGAPQDVREGRERADRNRLDSLVADVTIENHWGNRGLEVAALTLAAYIEQQFLTT